MGSGASAENVIARVVDALTAAAVPYMLTGSFASSFYGAPRTTQDIDIVIAPVLGTLNALIRQFPEEAYYVSRDAAMQAYGAEELFNVIDFTSGWKVDFIIRKSRPFSVAEFERRREVALLGRNLLSVASAEDVVISKLEWSKLSSSERQLSDVVGIIRTQGAALDQVYIEHWVRALGLQNQWDTAQGLCGPR